MPNCHSPRSSWPSKLFQTPSVEFKAVSPGGRSSALVAAPCALLGGERCPSAAPNDYVVEPCWSIRPCTKAHLACQSGLGNCPPAQRLRKRKSLQRSIAFPILIKTLLPALWRCSAFHTRLIPTVETFRSPTTNELQCEALESASFASAACGFQLISCSKRPSPFQ